MRLAAVVGLVVEHMGESQGARHDTAAVVEAAGVRKVAGQPGIGEVGGPGFDLRVLGFTGALQFGELIDQASAFGDTDVRHNPAGEATEPAPIGPQKMVEGGVQRAEEQLGVLLALSILQGRGGTIEPRFISLL